MNIFLRANSILRTFARIAALSLLSALFTVPSVVASNAVSYETGVDEMYLLPPGTTSDRTGDWYNIQLDGGNSYVGGANLALTPNSFSTVGGGPTHYGYATENTLVVKRITSPYSETWECVPWGSLFNNTTDLSYSGAVSKVPFLYDPALAGKMVEFFAWNQELGMEYTPGMQCDIGVAPLDNNAAFGLYNLLQAAFTGNIYYAGLTSDTETVQWSPNSLPLLNTVASGGATFTWANTNSESLTVVTMAHQTSNSYGSDSYGWTPAREYDAPVGAIADTPTVIACFSAKNLKNHTFGVTGNYFVFDSSNYEYMASNRPQVQITVMDNAYLGAGTSCETQYVNAFIGLGTLDANNHPPTETFPMQLPVAIPNVLTVNPGESLTATTIDPALNGPIMGAGSLDIWVKPTGSSDTDWMQYGEALTNSMLYGGSYNWQDFMDCSLPAGAEVKFNLFADGSYPTLSTWDSIASTTFTIHFAPQDSTICQNATPIAPAFTEVTFESLTVSSTANDYLVLLPVGTETLRFNPLFNNGTVTTAWYNDFQTIESATVDGVPTNYGDMPVNVDLTNAPHIMVVTYYVVSPDRSHSTFVTYTFAHTAPASGPTVTGISPAIGSSAGGQSVTIGGGTFLETPTATVGGVACEVTAFTATTVTCTTGAHALGVVNVAVANPGTLSTTLSNAYTYVSAPTITLVEPESGTTSGGTGISITGTGFVETPTITINGVPCTDVYLIGSTFIGCTTGPGTQGTGDVIVTNPDSGSATAVDAYTYTGPSIGLISPNSGPIAGGTSITITGTGFDGGTSVTVGGSACTSLVVVSSTELTCITAAHDAGAVDVEVTVPDFGTATASGAFTYVAPVAKTYIFNRDIFTAGITIPSGVTVNPAANPAQGLGVIGANDVVIHVPFGTNVTSLPFNFTVAGGNSMVVGSTPQVSGVTLNNFTTPVTYTVIAPDGTSKRYTVTVIIDAAAIDPLSIGSISPKAGPVTGGTSVNITGTGFTSGTNVTVGGAACSPATYVSSTKISCVTAAHVAGVVDVVVADSGKSATAAGAYTYADGTVQLGPLPANAGLKPGTSFVTVDGVPYQINVAPNGDANAIQLTATDWNLKLQAKGENGQPLALDNQDRIIVDPGLAAAFTGTGFMPNSDVYVYAFSDPKFMGVIRTDKNGNFSSALAVPNLAVGGHTIQLNGLSPKGEVRSASVGVVVQPKTLVASGKVYFAYASSKLNAKAKSAIAAIAKKAKAAKGSIMIKVVGWAQPTANSKRHVALSKARAAAVAKALKAAGVKGKYSISGKGLAKSNVPASRYAVITVNVDRK